MYAVTGPELRPVEKKLVEMRFSCLEEKQLLKARSYVIVFGNCFFSWNEFSVSKTLQELN